LKAEFIRSKYQFLQFINKQKDGEVSSIDDLSKVRLYILQIGRGFSLQMTSEQEYKRKSMIIEKIPTYKDRQGD
jgi:hypothetical protein